MKATTTIPAALTIEIHPSWEQLNMWWADMHADPEDIRVAFNDLMSRDLDIFLQQDLIWAFVYQGKSLVTASWLHDIRRNADETPVAGWIGGWVAKPFRGPIGKTACLLVVEAFLQQGVRHIHSSINVANRASYRWTRRAMGFTPVDIFPGLSPYNGVATDCHILTLNPEDKERAWEHAEAIARRRWPERYAMQGGSGRVQNDVLIESGLDVSMKFA